MDWAMVYCNAVMDGKIQVSKKNKQAVQRHIRDIKRVGQDGWPYFYDSDRANIVISYMESLPDIKTGKPNNLALFQKFIISELYGWVKYNKENQIVRRFNKAYISMARKNGKTILVAGIASYEFLFGTNPAFSRQIYCTANSKDQAKIAFSMVVKQLNKVMSVSPSIRKRVRKVREELTDEKSYSILRPLSKDTGSIDGFEPQVGILDEYHASSTTEMMEVLESGQVLLDNSLTLIISTAGFELNGPMYRIEYPYITKLLKGDIENDNYFVYCAEQDSEEEISDPESWIKSNPLMENETMRDILYDNISKKLGEALVKNDPNKTYTKNFNMWRAASDDSYINEADWKTAIAEQQPNIEGKDVYIGVDLSRADDLTACGMVIPLGDDKWYIDSHAFVGTKGGLDAKSERDRIDYKQLSKMGYATITDLESGIVDFKQLLDYVQDYVDEHDLNVRAFCYDPYNAQSMVADMEHRHITWNMIEVRQGFKTLSEPTKNFRNCIYSNQIVHSDNPVLTMAVHNAIIRTDNDNIMIDKKVNREKIDTLVSVMDAWTEAMFHYKENNVDPFLMFF